MDTVKFNSVEEKIIVVRDIPVLLDSDVAELYGVETKRINEAVKNNEDKFPKGYILSITEKELENLRSKFSTANLSSMTRVLPKAFTEKGLYMLATILKSKKATQTTIDIVETFTKIRELARTINEVYNAPDELKQKTLMQKGGDIVSDILGSDLKVTDSETSIEINAAIFKIKHTVKRKSEN